MTTPSDTGNRSVARLTFIDSMRGAAALWVMLFHFYYAIGGAAVLQLPSGIVWFFEIGDQGVFIFFVLSGFVISMSVKWEKVSGNYLLRFILRRSIRLDPPYWIVIILTGASVAVFSMLGLSAIEPPIWSEYFLNFFYLDNLTGSNSIVAVGWTLQYEIQFYLFFIFLVWLLKNNGKVEQSSFILLLTTGIISVLYWFSWFPVKIPGLFLNYWMYFLLGVFTEWITSKKMREKNAYLLMIFLVIVHGIVFAELSAFIAIATSLLLYAAGRADAWHKWLNFKLMIFLGAISYSLYLLHPFFGNRLLRFVTGKLHPVGLTAWGIFVGTIVLTLVLVYIFYRLVEKPTLQLSRKIKLK